MSLYFPKKPSQGAENIELTSFFLEDSTLAGLQTKINAIPNLPTISSPQPAGQRWISDIQFQAASSPGGINYSVMIVVGEYNPP